MDWLTKDVQVNRTALLGVGALMVLTYFAARHNEAQVYAYAFNAGRLAGFDEGAQAARQSATGTLPAAQGRQEAQSSYEPPQFGGRDYPY